MLRSLESEATIDESKEVGLMLLVFEFLFKPLRGEWGVIVCTWGM